MRYLLAAAAAALAASAMAAPSLAPAQAQAQAQVQTAAQDFAITNVTLALGDGSGPIENGTVVVRNGQIAAAGAGVAFTPDIPVIDGSGLWATPGIFAALTDLGLYDVGAVWQSNDTNADHALFSAALDISPAINPDAQNVKVSRAGGVTRASVTPRTGNSIFAGQGALIDLGADPDAVTRPRAFQYAEFGEFGASRAGGSRSALHITFVNALAEAQDLAARGNVRNPARNDDALLNRPDAEALIPVMTGAQTLYLHVDRAADIRSTLKLKQRFPKLDLVLVGAAEGWLVADLIADAGVPVITTALTDLPESFEQLGSTQSNVGRMVEAGVTVAIGEFLDMNQPRYAPQQAGNLVALTKLPGAAGLSWGQALAAITSVPAAISGMGGKAGVLAPGAVGDVVLWDGDPLEISSAPLRVFIGGVEQPLDSHQTRLKDRYRTPTAGDLPKAYEW